MFMELKRVVFKTAKNIKAHFSLLRLGHLQTFRGERQGRWRVCRIMFMRAYWIAHFTVVGENEAGVDLVFIQPFLLYYVNHVFLMLTSIF